MLVGRASCRRAARNTSRITTIKRFNGSTTSSSYRSERLKIWERAKALQPAPSNHPIQITLPNGSIVEGRSGITTPLNIASGISKGLAEDTVVARLNNAIIWDAMRPLEENCSLELLKWSTESKITQKVFWHSTSHLLGNALELHFPDARLCDGPAVDQGFFYELALDQGNAVSSTHFGALTELIKKAVDAKLPFERIVLSRELAREMFWYNPYKLRMLEKIPANDTITAYKCGDFVDLCKGPHIPSTSAIRAVALDNTSSAVFDSGDTKQTVQRVHGISFPQAKLLKELQTMRAEAAKRDHRVLGKAQSLFMFHPYSAGSPFFLPHGARVYNKLIDFMRTEYRKRGYQEVITPIVYNQKLWETSGHWQHYKDNMFAVRTAEEKGNPTEAEKKEQLGLKPMNCPGHCLIFENTSHSYRDLPLRLADFGMLHRNEFAGALTGLTRVIRFQQDDAHIFCTEEQLYSEIKECLDFIQHVYKVLNFPYALKLSTRPESFMGEIELWNKAEDSLRRALQELNLPFTVNEADGAFYGPKIDVDLTDAIGRKHQCATVQLDFQLPRRFNLSYVTDTGEKKTPVMIHRAIFGSLERMMAVLIEHTGGKWPFWLSPRQLVVVPVTEENLEYAKSVKAKLAKEGFFVDVDNDTKSTLQKKIREAQVSQYNFILVVGRDEQASETVNVRTRDNAVHGGKSIPSLITELRELVSSYK